MTVSRRTTLKYLGAATASAVLPTAAFAAGETEAEMASESDAAAGPVTHEVQMYSKHPDNKKLRNTFSPTVLKMNVGDTVKFVSAQKGHNSVSDKNMMPEGAEGWKSKLNEDFEVTLTVEGTYGYYCSPHRGIGMVGLLLVGDASGNYEDAKGAKQKGKAKKVYKKIFEEADEMMAG